MRRLLFSFFLLLSLRALGQENPKTIIGIIPFNYAESSYKKQAEQLQDLVTRAFNANKRISLLDRSKTAAIQKELDIQKGKEYIGGKTVKQNKAYGAQYLIIGTITRLEAEKSKFSGVNPFNKKAIATTTTYNCKLGFTLQKVDVTTGEVNETKLFDVATSGGFESDNYKKDSDPAKNVVQTNSQKISAEVDKWVKMQFPPVMKFLQIEDRDKKGFPKTVTIVADNESHVSVGDLISVLEITNPELDGKRLTRKAEVAVLKAKKIQGDVILCTIVDGEKIIEEKTQNRKQLEIVAKTD